MKILFCINSLVKGGAERVLANLANELSRNNEVSIITLINYDEEYKLNNNINLIKIDKRRTNPYKKKSKLEKILKKIPKLIIRTINIKKQIKNINPDVIISFLPEISFLVLLNKRKSDKVIISVRNDPKIEYSSKLYNYLMRKLYPKADGFVFQTIEAQEYFKDKIKCKTCVIHNPINDSFIIEEFNKGKERKKEIVSVGRLTKQKNFDLLIEAFAGLSKEYIDYKLIIYGEGELRKKLERKIDDLKLSDRVFLPGITNDVKKEIKNSSIFVLSSNYEGMPNALMEAMALGLPVISTDCPCGGPKELIENNVNGILVEVNNKTQLLCAIEKILSNEKIMDELGNQARNISKTHNIERINEKWINYIKEIICGE